MKLWYQVTVDFLQHPAFARKLEERTNQVASPGTTVTVHGMDRDINHGLTQTDVLMSPASFTKTIVRLFLRNVRKAEAAGCDAFVIGTYAEPALRELRSLVDIPVVSAAEICMFTAFSHAPKVAMIGLSHQTVPFIRASIARHRQAERISGIYVVNEVMTERTLDGQFDNPGPYIERFIKTARIAIAEGADAIIPAEGMVATIIGQNGVSSVDDVPIIDGVGVPVIAAEAAVTMQRRLKIGASRRNAYIKPTPAALEHFFGDPDD